MEANTGDIPGGGIETFDTDVFIHRWNSDCTVKHLVLLQVFVLFDELAESRFLQFSLVTKEPP